MGTRFDPQQRLIERAWFSGDVLSPVSGCAALRADVCLLEFMAIRLHRWCQELMENAVSVDVSQQADVAGWMAVTSPLKLSSWLRFRRTSESDFSFLFSQRIYVCCVEPRTAILYLYITGWFVGVFAKLRKGTVSFIMSARLSAWNNSASTGRVSVKFYIWDFFFPKICRENAIFF
jgi:hypothetical protein